MKIRPSWLGVLIAICWTASGCSTKAGSSQVGPLALGETCTASPDQPLVGTEVVSPATDCASNDCLFQPANGTNPAHATCTQTCAADADCAAQDGTTCQGGLACAVAVLTGPFACTKLCVCRADLLIGLNVDGNGAVITPEVCGGGQGQGSGPADMSQ